MGTELSRAHSGTILSDETWTGNRREVGSESFLNQRVAERLRETAELLEQQQANPFRVSAYRRAADTVAGLDEDVAERLEREGIEGLDALPGIGSALAQAIAQMVCTGRWASWSACAARSRPSSSSSWSRGSGRSSPVGSTSIWTSIPWKRWS